MSENTRKVFDIEEQKAKDLSLVIQTITPVINLIRKWGSIQRERSVIEKEVDRLEEEIGAFDIIVKSLQGDIVSELEREQDQRRQTLSETLEKYKEIQQADEDLESEVISYQKYTRCYKWVTEFHVKMLLEANDYEYEESLALMFWVHNSESNIRYDYEPLTQYIREHVDNSIVIMKWNTMLEALKAYKI